MTAIQLITILLFFSFTGWFISWMIIKMLFWPVRPLVLGFLKLQGLVPAMQKQLAHKAGQLVQDAFTNYNGLDEKLADPQLIATLKPAIEEHVDHFLQVKIKTVFPIIAQFMGEKTINQFKEALLTEIDNLLPVLMKRYAGELKHSIKLDQLVEERINQISTEQVKEILYANSRKQLFRFKIVCTLCSFIIGLVAVLIVFLFNM